MAAMAVCSLSPASSIGFAFAGEKSLQGGRRELSLGHGRGRRRSGMHAWACKAEEEDEGRKEVVSDPLDLQEEFRKALDSDESKIWLKLQSVSQRRRELDELNRREKKAEELQSFLQRLDGAVSEIEEEVLKAEAEVRIVELALIMACAGNSAIELSSKWKASYIDEDVKRIESGKAATVSTIVGTFVSLPFTIAIDGGLSLGALLNQVGILVSCALFGVTCRYAICRDLEILQLKSEVVAAFGLVRGAGYATQALSKFPKTNIDDILKASLVTGESVLIFLAAAVALDYCLRVNVLGPFPLRNNLSYYHVNLGLYCAFNNERIGAHKVFFIFGSHSKLQNLAFPERFLHLFYVFEPGGGLEFGINRGFLQVPGIVF